MEKKLSLAHEIKQKLKGTWDSPCVEVCAFQMEHPFCRECGLKRAEKKSWPQLSAAEKISVSQSAAARRTREMVVTA